MLETHTWGRLGISHKFHVGADVHDAHLRKLFFSRMQALEDEALHFLAHGTADLGIVGGRFQSDGSGLDVGSGLDQVGDGRRHLRF
jgi:hypothetical protein